MNPQTTPLIAGRKGWRQAVPVLFASILAGLPLLNRVGALEITALLGVTALASWVAWRNAITLTAAASAEHSALAADPKQGGEALPNLLVGVLPVWLEHVASVKTQVEEAITQLATSFSSITGQFEAAGFKGANGDNGGADRFDATFSLLTLCDRQLQPMIGAMTRILESKGALMSSVNDLAKVTADLETMASAVGQIAMNLETAVEPMELSAKVEVAGVC